MYCDDKFVVILLPMWNPVLGILPGADPGFQVRGGGDALKQIAPSGGRRENVWVFRVKNHDFTSKNHIFSNIRGGGGAPGRVRPPPPSGSAPDNYICICKQSLCR